ncbi:YqcC family protein [Thalassotalea agarivorans]|uniref:Uncharacterized conserved protein YqcC, DUF446 family n=1 Tax=Thalassotalea agarivorans TaxID=349064 RepID=A0A1I0DM50_THASX|nr:YqcC family protein [Thalassotalea agarivorans]SET33590.1 Uncharacterized conserved protein YqcC, DUF446 family [Thalassotalea agarivorans]
MQTLHQQLLTDLARLETTLKQADLWADIAPTPQQLASQQPFCIDTMTLQQWLQFVFIEKLTVLALNEQPLPMNIAVSPIAEQVFKDHKAGAKLVADITAIDSLLSGQAHD